MKPSITIDERGAVLHFTDDKGEGIAVALNVETLTEINTQATAALERLKEPETRSQIFWNVGRALVRELLKPSEKK